MKSNRVSYNILKPRVVCASISMILLNPVWALGYFSHIRSFQTLSRDLDILSLSQVSYGLWAKKKLVDFDLNQHDLDDFGSGSGGGGGDRGGGDRGGKLYTPKSDAQRLYVSHLQDPKIPLVLALGPAGCGKTLFACMQAAAELKRGMVEKIVITRPLVSVEEEQIGFLPGNMVSKMDPWTRPMIDLFREFYSMTDIQNMIRQGVIEIAPLAFMRGRTFHRSFVIADEMQNSSPNQMMMLTTRLGMESKMVITGDLQQSDRGYDRGYDRGGDRRADCDGLADFLDRYRVSKHDNYDLIRVVELSSADVFRSPLVSRVLQIYDSCDSSRGSRSSQSSQNLREIEVSEHSSETTESYELLSPGKSPSRSSIGSIPLRDMGRPYPDS